MEHLTALITFSVISGQSAKSLLDEKWAEEFEDLTAADIEALSQRRRGQQSSSQEDKDEFWNKLEGEWKDMATSSDHPWLSDFNDEHQPFEEYKFKDDNPLKDHPDPMEEGLSRLEQGERDGEKVGN
jgi:peroxin-5